MARYVAPLESRLAALEGASKGADVTGKRKRDEAGSATLSQTTGSPRALLSRLEHLSPSGSAEVQPSSVQLLQQLPRMSELDDVILRPRDSTAAAAAAAALGDDLAKHPFLPPRPDADRMVSSYLEFNASTYPIFHRPTLLQQIDDLYQSAQTTKSTDVYNLYIILALSHEMERHGKGPGREADHAQEYWDRAQEYARHALYGRSSLEKLQALHLTLQFILQRPDLGSIWDMCGQDIRVALDLGLNFEPPERPPAECLQTDLRRRLFWCTYISDRMICIALGKPLGIHDEWVNAKFPSLVPDVQIGPHSIAGAEIDQTKLSFHHHIRLRLIQSAIYHRLFAPGSVTQPPPTHEWFTQMDQHIGAWYAGNPNPDRDAPVTALASAAYVMRNYRTMYRARAINILWLARHHLYVSGITYLNVLWMAKKNGWTIVKSAVDAMLDIHACSQTLEGMYTTCQSTSMRDAFDTVTSAIVQQLQTDSDGSKTATDNQAPLPISFAQDPGASVFSGLAESFIGNGLSDGTADPSVVDFSSLEALLLDPMRDLEDPYNFDFLLDA